MNYSTIQAVDFAIGRWIAEAFPIEVTPTGPKNWCDFAKRPIAQKIMRGDFDSATEVISSIESSQKQSHSSGKFKHNPASLPMIAYGRKAGISPSEADAGAIINTKTVEVLSMMDVQLVQVDIDYKMLFMAWDIPTIDQMQINWMFYAASHSEIPYKVEIQGEEVELNVRILDAKTPLFEDASIPAKENRLHAVMLALSARTYVMKGQKVTIPDPISIHFSGGHIA